MSGDRARATRPAVKWAPAACSSRRSSRRTSRTPSRRRGPLAGKRVLLTAGPTRERIDPVRFISNRSSGKDGLCGRRRRARGGRRRHHRVRPGEHRHAARRETHRCRKRRRHAERGHEEHRRRRHFRRHRRGGRLSAREPGRVQDQEDFRVDGSQDGTHRRHSRDGGGARMRGHSWWASQRRRIPWNNTRARNSSRRTST